jgi:hypothetical protein
MGDHLFDFDRDIRASKPACTLADYARALSVELDRVIPDAVRQRERVAVHLAGFNKEDEPEFWSVQKDDGARRTFLAREDFRRRDAAGASDLDVRNSLGLRGLACF